jgi:tetratricopeptide (TPR) repeat protein
MNTCPPHPTSRPARRARTGRAASALLALLLITGCSTLDTAAEGADTASAAATATTPAADWLATALQALRQGQTRTAQAVLQDGLARHPRSAQGHLMLAVAHHLEGDDTALDLAGTGYGLARRFAADVFWPPFLAGVSALQRQQSAEALSLLAEAVAADPTQPLGLEALAAAAYLQGEFGLAKAAADQALRLDPTSARAARTALMARAASGDHDGVQQRLTAPGAHWPADLRRRTAQLLRTAAAANAPAGSAGAAPAAESQPHPDQLSVDVVLILSDGRDNRSLGFNLLDGLRISYGFDRVSNSTAGSTAAITRTLRVTDLNYSLNIANRSTRRYQMAARPSLTAFVGQPSSFFVGEQLVVQTSGVNTAQLERIDVGVRLSVTPSQVRADGAQFRVEADRSFFSDVPGGTFREQLSIFKQSVSATADVRFGETLVLSGLQEQVLDHQDSKVPGLGDVPGPNLLFNQSNQRNRQRSVLILVTPSQPLGFARGTGARAAAVEKLVELWDQVIEPGTGAGATAELLRRRFPARKVTPADVAFPDLRDSTVREALLERIEQNLPPPPVAPAARNHRT